MKTRKLFVLSLALLLLVAGSIGSAWALGTESYNRPTPLMDYVPQEIGIYDTRYDALNPDDILGEAPDCRACHGNTLADRHHYSDIVVVFRRCTDCHEVIPEPPGVTLTRDCTTSGCHSWDDLGPLDGAGTGTNGWHHSTDESGADNCVACHDRQLVAELSPFRTMVEYPPSVVTPTPFSCENCHWSQDVVVGSDAPISATNMTAASPIVVTAASHGLATGDTVYIDNITGPFPWKNNINKTTFTVTNLTTNTFSLDGTDGSLYGAYGGGGEVFVISGLSHPGTFGHLNQWGQELEGYFAYDKIIYDNDYTHHMGGKGNVSNNCLKCHSNDPNQPEWDPSNPELIRYCEICHDVGTLHTIVPHVGQGGTGDTFAVSGWEATGFHAAGSGTEPTVFRDFTANEQCFGCHADLIEDPVPDPISAAAIYTLTPTAACPNGDIEIVGAGFGEEQYVGSYVQVKEGTDWINVPVLSWTDTRIVFHIPGWTFTTGNHKVRVWVDIYPVGMKKSNAKGITIKDCVSATTITPEQTACQIKKLDKTILGGGTGNFGVRQDTISGTGDTDGVYRALQISASQGEYIALSVNKWGNNEIKFQMKDFFQDLDGDYIQDANEPTIEKCATLTLGNYAVKIIYIFYVDDDNSATLNNNGTPGDLTDDYYDGGYTNGDTVYQIEDSNPVYIELINEPYIKTLSPRDLAKTGDIIRIFGDNFGPAQLDGEVRLGKKAQAKDDVTMGLGKLQTKIKNWTNTRIKFRLKPKPAWVGKMRAVWIEKGGMKSNYRMIQVVP